MPWVHMEPIPGHPIAADIDVTTLPDAVRFGVAGDFDGDGFDELVLAPDRDNAAAHDLWVMKYGRETGVWNHLSPIQGHRLMADIDLTAGPHRIAGAFVGNFDGRGAQELAVIPFGQPGLWVMRYDAGRKTWDHFSPQPNDPIRADIALPWPVKFAVAGDFDGDGIAEIAVMPDQAATIWVMKYKGGGTWYKQFDLQPQHVQPPFRFLTAGRFDGGPHWLALAPVTPAPGTYQLEAIRRDAGQFVHVPLMLNNGAGVPRFAVVGVFEGDGREQLALNIAPGPGKGDEFWVLTCSVMPGGGYYWRPHAEIVGHPLKAAIDCCQGRYGARFGLAGDFNGDGRDELVVAPEATGSEANDLWVMRYDGHDWVHLSPLPSSRVEADLDISPLRNRPRFAVPGRYGADRTSLAVAIDGEGSQRNDLWVMHLADTTGPKVKLIGTLTMAPIDPLGRLSHPLRTQLELELQFNPFRHRFTARSVKPLPLAIGPLALLTGHGTADTGTGAMTLTATLEVKQSWPNGSPAVTRQECWFTTGQLPGHGIGSPVRPLTGEVTLLGETHLKGGPLNDSECLLTLTGRLVPNPLA